MVNQQAYHRVAVPLTDGRAYDILIGRALIAHIGSYISPFLGRPHVAIISDEHVAAHHLQTLTAALDKAGIASICKILPAGEATKSFAQLDALCAWLLDEKIERHDMIIAFGGGVIGDLTGFAASILRRGTQFIQIPTTLLAQVDSSVGGKTAINVAQGKNLIGSFYQPKLVLADNDMLTTLPARQWRAGYAEVVKYAALGDARFFSWLGDHKAKLRGGDAATMSEAVRISCQAKADIVERDEREHGERALLNLGHTFGHAFEAVTGYGDKLLHGEAVALGMAFAFRLSVKMGLCPSQDADALCTHLTDMGLPTRMSDIAAPPFACKALIEAMTQDKKAKAGQLRFILARGVGKAFISDDVDNALLTDFLRMQGAR